MRITLNLATRPFADTGPALKRLRIAMGVMALMSVLFGLGLYLLHNKAQQARARDHSLDGQIAAINHERQGYQNMMSQPENVQLLAESSTLNRLFDEKTFSWTLAMEDLETVLPGGVQVSTLEPIREKDGRITLRLRVIGPRDRAIQLVENLEHSKRFTLPRIVGENSETTGAPGQRLEPVSASNRVNFDLQAQYNPTTLAEFQQAAKVAKSSAYAAPTERPARTTEPSQAHRLAARKPVPGAVHSPRAAVSPPSSPRRPFRPGGPQ